MTDFIDKHVNEPLFEGITERGSSFEDLAQRSEHAQQHNHPENLRYKKERVLKYPHK